MNRSQIVGLCNSVIMVADKFIKKCEEGKARSHETLSDLIHLRAEAVLLKSQITSKND